MPIIPPLRLAGRLWSEWAGGVAPVRVGGWGGSGQSGRVGWLRSEWVGGAAGLRDGHVGEGAGEG